MFKSKLSIKRRNMFCYKCSSIKYYKNYVTYTNVDKTKIKLRRILKSASKGIDI